MDQIGGLNDAVDYAVERAKLGSRYRVKEYPEQVNFAETLALLLGGQQEPVSRAKPDLLTQQLVKMKSDLKTLQDFNDPLGTYARMPLGLELR